MFGVLKQRLIIIIITIKLIFPLNSSLIMLSIIEIDRRKKNSLSLFNFDSNIIIVL